MSAPADSTAIVVVKRPRAGLFAAVRGVPVWLRVLARGEAARAVRDGAVEPSLGPAIGRASTQEPASPSAEGGPTRATTVASSEAEASPESAGWRAALLERGATFVESAAPALAVEVPATAAGSLLRGLRDGPDPAFDVLHDLTVVDRLPDTPRFEVVYFLRASATSTSLRVRVRLETDPPEIDSVAALWPSAAWLEREAKELFGIRFVGHPGLQNLLLPPDFEGAPLRRDFAAAGEGTPS